MTKRIAIPEQTIAVLLDSAESEVEELLSEIESWKGNLEGASMEHLPKYDEVAGCYEALETARDTLQSAVEDARLLPAEILAVPIAMKAIPGRYRSRGGASPGCRLTSTPCAKIFESVAEWPVSATTWRRPSPRWSKSTFPGCIHDRPDLRPQVHGTQRRRRCRPR